MSNDYSDINNYEMGKEIGEGNFGKVRLATFKPTGEQFAIKILNKKKIKKQMKSKMLRENEIITKLNHINIVFVYKIIETEEDYFIVMEYCKLGELFDYIVKKKKLHENEASVFFYQLINGVEYIHSKGIAHRDLKPENLLLTEDKVLKIIDFGLSHEFSEDQFLKTKCGSPSYAAPEIISMPQYDGFKIDIWCCGIILYAMLCGYLPFDADSETESNNLQLFRNILECEPELPDFLSNISKHLICEILNPDPDERITIKQIKRHPFYLKGKKLCKIDYSSYNKEIKTRESFYKSNNENKRSKNKLLEEINRYLENNKDKNDVNNNDIITKTEGNLNLQDKNSIDALAKNNYKLTINDDNKTNNININNHLITTIDNNNNNIEKSTKAKLYLLSLKTRDNQKNEINTFKKKFYPINLHNYNQKKIDKINNRIEKILNTEVNENGHFGLPYIGLRDAETIFNCLMSTKLNPSIENTNIGSNNNSINIKKNEEETNLKSIYKSPVRFGPQIPSKINRNSLGFKINSVTRSKKPNFINYHGPGQFLFENINQKMENNNNISNNNDIANVYKNPKTNDERLKEKFNLNINNKRANGNNPNTINATKAINTYSPISIAYSLSNDKTVNRRKKFNRFNYDYDYNFNISPKKNIIIKDSFPEALNITHNINNININNINNKIINNQIKTIIPLNIKHSDQNIKTIMKKYIKGENQDKCKSPEIKSIYNNIKINININSNTVNKDRDTPDSNMNNNKFQYNFNTDNPKKKINKKLYLLTDANKDNNNEVYKSILISPNKENNINSSEKTNKIKGISLQNNNKFNLTKRLKKAKNERMTEEQDDTIKKNKSYIDNHSCIENDEEPKLKKNFGNLKIINKDGIFSINKRKNREDVLRDILFNSKKYHKNNFNNIIGSNNNHFLPKINDNLYNSHQTEKII